MKNSTILSFFKKAEPSQPSVSSKGSKKRPLVDKEYIQHEDLKTMKLETNINNNSENNEVESNNKDEQEKEKYNLIDIPDNNDNEKDLVDVDNQNKKETLKSFKNIL